MAAATRKEEVSPDCTDTRVGVRSSNLVLQLGHDDHSGIPRALVGRHFADIDTFHDELELLGLSDSEFILNGDGLVTMPGDERNGGTRFHSPNTGYLHQEMVRRVGLRRLR